jgi:hypothetical protein
MLERWFDHAAAANGAALGARTFFFADVTVSRTPRM